MHVPQISPTARLVWGGHSCPPTAESKGTQAGNFRSRLLLTFCTLPLALTPCAAAQRTASAHAVAPHAVAPHTASQHFNSPAGRFAFGRNTYASRFRRTSSYTSLPFPFFGDSFNPDDIYSTGYPVASQPPVILLQAARALATPAEYADREPPLSQPLVIELQNGRYVRITSTAANGEPLPLASSPSLTKPKSASTHSTHPPEKIVIPSKTRDLGFASAASSPPRDLPPALLVFRDGHSVEVRDYTIADGILYASGDYYTDGYWTKRIALSTLNVSQTLEANAQRNVKFVLPSSPNEVITRP